MYHLIFAARTKRYSIHYQLKQVPVSQAGTCSFVSSRAIRLSFADVDITENNCIFANTKTTNYDEENFPLLIDCQFDAGGLQQ